MQQGVTVHPVQHLRVHVQNFNIVFDRLIVKTRKCILIGPSCMQLTG